MGWIERFYNSAAWRAKSERIMKRDKYLCVECRRYGRRDREGNPVAAEVVHHIVPLEVDPSKKLDSENLQSLCRRCHNKKHPEKGIPPGMRRGSPRA